MKNLKFAAISLLLMLGACASGQSNPAASDSLTVCIDPRPQICTMDYTPVCAELQNGETKTYANACGACADADVVSHRASACE